MNCPRCANHALSEIDRDGVTIDRCDACRGIWLDRGELEKLTARAGRGRDRRRERDDRNADDDDDDDDRRGGFWSLFD